MPLTSGTRLGAYEIISTLGAGGMGEVYRARDPRLDRHVAIKVLPDAVVDDPDRLARFEREAKVLAALNHPLIAHVYGFEQIGEAAVGLIAAALGVRVGPAGLGTNTLGARARRLDLWLNGQEADAPPVDLDHQAARDAVSRIDGEYRVERARRFLELTALHVAA
jgi:hypothetical protein